MMFIIRPHITFQFHFFGFSEYSDQSFPYYNFQISGYIFWVWMLTLFCKQMTFDFTSHMILSHLLSVLMNEKLECKGHQV